MSSAWGCTSSIWVPGIFGSATPVTVHRMPSDVPIHVTCLVSVDAARRPTHLSEQPYHLAPLVDVDRAAAGTFGRPGMVMMSPQTITTNSAPAAAAPRGC